MDIPSFYRGKSVFVTGGTGFIGKMLIEKLLRSCSDLDQIFVLVRGKGGKSPEERLNVLFDGELFEPLKLQNPDFRRKVVPVVGELTAENMGLSDEDLVVMRKKVSVIFHVAATIKFREKLKLAVDLNIISVRRIIELARSLAKCESVVYVSTAYAHTNRALVEEKIYKPDYDHNKLITVMNELDVDMAEALVPFYTKDRPNTYTFTKSIAEYLFAVEGKGLPRAILRPSIVTSSWREPAPGWVDNYNGPIGMMVAVGTGVMRVAAADSNNTSDTVPVDIVTNMAVAISWHCAAHPTDIESENVPVFNCNSSTQNRCTWGMWSLHVTQSMKEIPFENKLYRRPRVVLLPTLNWEHKLWTYVYHYIPAAFTDLVLRLQGKKPYMRRIFQKIDAVFDEYHYFATHEWKWENRNGPKLLQLMSESDRQNFNFDINAVSWPKYFEDALIGVKKYLLKEQMASLHVAHKNRRWLVYKGLLLRMAALAVLARFVVPLLHKRGVSGAWLLLIPLVYLSRRL